MEVKKIKLEKQSEKGNRQTIRHTIKRELVIKLDLYIGKSVCYKTETDRQTDTIGTKS